MGNEVLNTLFNRTTSRSYLEKDIEEEKKELIFQAALRAPSASNMMHYSIIEVDDKEKKKEFQRINKDQPYITQAPLLLLFCADYQRQYDYYVNGNTKKACDNRGIEFKAPDESNLLWAVLDASFAAHNVVVAAESMGLSSCYLGHMLSQIEKSRRLLNLPRYVFPVVGLIIGYHNDEKRKVKTNRYDEKFIIHKDAYCRADKEDLIKMYGSENAAENYINKFGLDRAYDELTRSVKEILKSWNGIGGDYGLGI